jgi:hypothetical protein
MPENRDLDKPGQADDTMFEDDEDIIGAEEDSDEEDLEDVEEDEEFEEPRGQ